MRLNDLVEKLPFLNRVNTVLVCEIGHLGLQAAVVQRQGDHLTISDTAHSDALDLATAVAEVVSQVRQQGWVGKHALLMTPAVLQSLIDLPIPPKNKLTLQQIAEQVRWELEPLLAQHHSTYSSIGRILLVHGYITEEQVDDVLSQQNHYAGGVDMRTAKEFNSKRFGEIAIALGYIEQGQLNRCLAKQTWLLASDDAIQCGWSVQGKSPYDETDAVHYQWLVSAVNLSLLRQWQAAFSAKGIKLEALYPLSANAVGAIALDNKSKKHQLLLEVHDGLLTGQHLIGQQLCQLQTLPNKPEQTLDSCNEIYQLFANSEFDTIWLADASSRNEIEASQLLKNLSQVLMQPVKSVVKPAETIGAGTLGVARHFMNMQGASAIIGVPVEDPLPPLLQRIEIRAMLAGVGLLLVLGMAELFLQVRHSLIDYENEKISVDLKKIEAAISRVQVKADTVKKLKDEIKNNQEDKKEISAALGLISNDLPKRNQVVYGFLNELGKTVSDDVVIDRIVEDPVFGFAVSAWTLNERSAQEFINLFQLAVHPLGFKLKDIAVASQTGRLGLLGYSINFNATVLADSIWNAAKQSPNQANPLSNASTPASILTPSSPSPSKPVESQQ